MVPAVISPSLQAMRERHRNPLFNHFLRGWIRACCPDGLDYTRPTGHNPGEPQMSDERSLVPTSPQELAELSEVLRNSLYPGASKESVGLVLSYCKAARLDPMQKPVHIVPMSVPSGEKDSYGNDKKVRRDVIMPGVGLYRIQAARTGQYAGKSAPSFGPMMTMEFSETYWVDVPNSQRREKRYRDATMDYPEWCSVTVYRLIGGQRIAFEAVEFFDENYATKSADSEEPNAMWRRRPRGQLAKCAEAQALRQAFPEATGSAPTAEEMEGRYSMDPEDQPAPGSAGKPAVRMPEERPMESGPAGSATQDYGTRDPAEIAKAASAANKKDDVQDVEAKPRAGETIDQDSGEIHTTASNVDRESGGRQLASEGEKAHILSRLNRKGLTLEQACEAAQLDPRKNLDGLSADEFIALKEALR